MRLYNKLLSSQALEPQMRFAGASRVAQAAAATGHGATPLRAALFH